MPLQFQRLKFGKKRMLISISTDIDEKWFVFFEHNIRHFSFVCVHLDYFSFFPFFLFSLCLLFLLFFFLHLTFKPETQRDQTSIDSRIDITKNWRPPKIGSEMLEDSPQTGVQEFWTSVQAVDGLNSRNRWELKLRKTRQKLGLPR